MQEELISKKELLQLTDISYGQLYRWKRKNLIPEDWFIKKSSFTGQETFFPRIKILSRIDKIKNMKDEVPLDELADMFSPEMSDIVLSQKEMIEKNIVTQVIIDIYWNFHDMNKDSFSFEEILSLYITEKFLKSGEVGIDESKIILKTLEESYKKFEDKDCDVLLIRKFGIAVCLLLSVNSKVYLEEGAKMVFKINAGKCTEEIKFKVLG